jgi:hypothetical protein
MTCYGWPASIRRAASPRRSRSTFEFWRPRPLIDSGRWPRLEASSSRFSRDRPTTMRIVTAPPDWLDRLVGILLDNACKYSPDGGSVLVHVAAEGRRVRLTVDDSGPGIPEDERGRVFDRFHRATDQPGGAGLGLAIADAIVHATGGKLAHRHLAGGRSEHQRQLAAVDERPPGLPLSRVAPAGDRGSSSVSLTS